MTTRRTTHGLHRLLPALLVLAAGCGSDADALLERERETEARAEAALQRIVPRVLAASQAIADSLRPVPLLRSEEEAGLRRYLNRQQVARAEALGVDPLADSAAAQARVRAEELVLLADSTEYWVVRELEHSLPLVTPDTRALLEDLGRRFHARLDSLGLPPLRMEVTSALRTAASQADLRRTNANAARGTSAHEYGTTVDVAYNAFTPPQEPVVDVSVPEAPWLEPAMTRLGEAAVEAAAARDSRELKAILGRVLKEAQDEGKVMVTLERQQPVFHMTVAERLADR